VSEGPCQGRRRTDLDVAVEGESVSLCVETDLDLVLRSSNLSSGALRLRTDVIDGVRESRTVLRRTCESQKKGMERRTHDGTVLGLLGVLLLLDDRLSRVSRLVRRRVGECSGSLIQTSSVPR
jgi:hypothetical protein